MSGCFVYMFVKQKTADGVLISDWSSDVCSSDIQCLAVRPAQFSRSVRRCAGVQTHPPVSDRPALRAVDPRLDAVSVRRLDGGRSALYLGQLQDHRPRAGAGCGVRWLERRPSDRKSTRLNSIHSCASRMPSSAWTRTIAQFGTEAGDKAKI